MKVRMIGTANMMGNGVPASCLINDKILFDIPNGNHNRMKNNDLFLNTQHLFITHRHADHIFDAPFIMLAKYATNGSLNIYGSPKNLKTIKKLLKIGFPTISHKILNYPKIKFITSPVVKIDSILIKRFKVSHGELDNSFGYILTDNTKKLVITGDSAICVNVINNILNSTCAIVDCSYETGNQNHMGVNDIKYLLQTCNNTMIIPTHMSPESKEKLTEISNKNLNIKEDMSEFIL